MSEDQVEQVGFSGGCYWCIEAVFQSLVGVNTVRQGWIKPINGRTFTEGVLIDFQPETISLEVLIAVHLHTHNCTSRHALRYRYPSGIYVTSELQRLNAKQALVMNQADFDDELLTRVYDLGSFKLSDESMWNYYYANPNKPFCQTKIKPKLKALLDQFSDHVDSNKRRLINN
ncbi:peptide methionine sulfoxide reductase [Photobacterium sanctipauli]|uniref:peptide-methionine (S)-S-oxide reductase n=2 Tax=Photobacterium sanctipauli TaxID=1342794 RepID=A0A2T3NN11_9GAMM|nr:peptide-methionine (S)-S-oxide reductase [Photobacterium sanctipauli]PSW16904.1 peptide methionine sulfoxide reductase [Photobacterium sanctipauli]